MTSIELKFILEVLIVRLSTQTNTLSRNQPAATSPRRRFFDLAVSPKRGVSCQAGGKVISIHKAKLAKETTDFFLVLTKILAFTI